MSLTFYRSFLTLSALLLCSAFPALASAQPVIEPDSDNGLPFYATVGEEVTVYNTLMDEAPCRDNRYDEQSDEYLDPAGNDENMVGIVATLQSRPQGGGEWSDLKSKTVTADDLNVGCDEGEGAVDATVELSAPAAAVRSDYRIIYRGGADNVSLDSKPALMFPRFKETWKWQNAKNLRSVTVSVKADPRLAGVKFSFLLSTNKGFSSFKVVKRSVFKKRGANASVRIKVALPASVKKTSWRGYGCVNYQQKFPLMSTGNTCPSSGSFSAARMEELFPYSTQGGV